MSDKPRESFLVPEPVAYCYETPLHGWEIASRAAAAAEPELRWRAMVTLTDAEREFLQALHDAYQEMANQTGYVNAKAQADSRKNAATIRGMLERLGGAPCM